MVDRGLQWLFPERCVGCPARGTPLCDQCASLVPAPKDLESPGLLAAMPYEHPWVKKLIWRLKYYRGRHLAPRLAEIISERLLEELAELASLSIGAEKWLVVPVPVSAARRQERGFNQAEMIARHLVERNNSFLELQYDMVRKIKHTLPQAKILNKKARLANIAGSFLIANPEVARGRRLIVIDDVITTGATMNEIKRVLREAGARVVLGIAVAHG